MLLLATLRYLDLKLHNQYFHTIRHGGVAVSLKTASCPQHAEGRSSTKKMFFSSNPEGIQMAKWNLKLNGSIGFIFIWIFFAISSFVIPNELTFEHTVVENEKNLHNWMLHFEKPRFVRKYTGFYNQCWFPNLCRLLIKP